MTKEKKPIMVGTRVTLQPGGGGDPQQHVVTMITRTASGYSMGGGDVTVDQKKFAVSSLGTIYLGSITEVGDRVELAEYLKLFRESGLMGGDISVDFLILTYNHSLTVELEV